MAQSSTIEWTDATWNPVTGCSKVSPGCAHCYAESVTARFAGAPGWIEEHRPWTPENAEHNVRLHPERLEQPLRWRSPRMVFVNSMSDLFHENVPVAFIGEVFRVMHEAKQHVFQVLTKRPERALKVVQEILFRGDNPFNGSEVYWDPSPNVWLGVSIENARYTWRADVLREIPAAVRFISAEPLLGSLFPREAGGDGPATTAHDNDGAERALDASSENRARRPLDLSGIDWLIVGGESGGRDARPMHPEWARELRDACLCDCDPLPEPCTCERPAFFFKQWGSWAPSGFVSGLEDGREVRQVGGYVEGAPAPFATYYRGAGPKSAGRELDGRVWDEMPVREAVPA